MPRRVLIIVNPDAGRATAKRRHFERVVAALRERGCGVVVREAALAGDAERLARAAEAEFDVIVAAGGDGTIAAVANGVADAPRPIAILPLGTANVLAAEIGMPRGAEDCAAAIAEGSARPVWPGRIGGRLFLTSAGSGFDADIVARVDRTLKRHGGRFAFVWAALVGLCRFRARQFTVIADGVEHRAGGVIATTGPLYAGRFVIAPEASLDEPVLHLVLLRGGGRGQVSRQWAAMLRGRLPWASGVAILTARSVTIAGEEGAPVQADGDIAASSPVTLAIGDRSIPLVRPAKV